MLDGCSNVKGNNLTAGKKTDIPNAAILTRFGWIFRNLGVSDENKYSLEGLTMPYTMEQFRKEYIKAHLGDLDPEEILSRFKPEEIETYLKKLKHSNSS